MKTKELLFISFDSAKHICDKSQYSEASNWEKLKLRLRYWWCKATRAYVRRNKRLSEHLEKAQLHCLKPEELYQMHHHFNEHLEKNKE